ncbi:hypothetical protein LO762_09700 [Actinocorallia sp. API 0066]|uniref:hypothetical protein n=1 Tax=Actinocorallia sp. API 0066 TaxID=2896846 RepID=UPI001E4053C8|nr:hypothetical protein [Actinocorallia sp. API 0066]MCD0449462.1 hypothetical protein [Actinocorallia sp. API 0066]
MSEGSMDDADREAVERFVSVSERRLSREAERSLWLNRAVVTELESDADRVLGIARRNLERMRGREGWGRNPWLVRWRIVLDSGVDAVIEVLLSRDPEAVELRQNTPFAGVLPQEDRERLLAGFGRYWTRVNKRSSESTEASVEA